MKMKRFKNGCFVGKFLPPHIGHLSVIDRALSECEKVTIVLAEDLKHSKTLCEQANFPYFSPKERLEWIRQHYKNYNNINFIFFDEHGIKKDDLKSWSKKFKEKVKGIDAKYADESYRYLNEKYFPECTFIPVDRDKINIHGTDIRNNPENIKFMIEEGKSQVYKKLNDLKK